MYPPLLLICPFLLFVSVDIVNGQRDVQLRGSIEFNINPSRRHSDNLSRRPGEYTRRIPAQKPPPASLLPEKTPVEAFPKEENTQREYNEPTKVLTPEEEKARTVLTDLSSCQLATLRLGSEIADRFNSLPPYQYDTFDRVFQDLIIKHLGFAPGVTEGKEGSKKSITGSSTKDLQEKGGWVSHKGQDGRDHSNYDVFADKWIYMVGDSTVRQIWASYASHSGSLLVKNAKEWTRENCQGQSHRKRHPPQQGVFDEEGWRGGCGSNEVTCHMQGYGSKGRLTFDWKHFPFEDYDEYLFSHEDGPWNQTRRPDLLVVQTGLHSCFHSFPEGHMSHHLKDVNQNILNKHKSDILKLMGAIRRAIDNNPAKTNPTTVIVMTSGILGLGGEFGRMDACIQNFNRATSEAAMRYGFAVFDRAEIERRIMSQSYYSDNPYFLSDVHLLSPIPQLIGSLLLHFYQCIDKHGLSRSEELSSMSSVYPLQQRKAFRNWTIQ